MDFSGALAELKQGQKVSRAGWNGKGMYIWMHEVGEQSKMTLPYILRKTVDDSLYMKTADDNLVPWSCSQTDILADDWELYKGE